MLISKNVKYFNLHNIESGCYAFNTILIELTSFGNAAFDITLQKYKIQSGVILTPTKVLCLSRQNLTSLDIEIKLGSIYNWFKISASADAPWSTHARPSAQPHINTRGNFSVKVSGRVGGGCQIDFLAFQAILSTFRFFRTNP